MELEGVVGLQSVLHENKPLLPPAPDPVTRSRSAAASSGQTGDSRTGPKMRLLNNSTNLPDRERMETENLGQEINRMKLEALNKKEVKLIQVSRNGYQFQIALRIHVMPKGL